LAALAQTTPRYVSFIETGRSRPGRDLILRLAECLDVPMRDRNALLTAAGLGPVYAERELGERELAPFRRAVEAVLERHQPYPGCAMDGLGRVHLANRTFATLWPGLDGVSPEDAVEAFFGPGPMREVIENYAEVAWAYAEVRRHEAARTRHPRLVALTERILTLLSDVPRPSRGSEPDSPVLCPRFRFGDQVVPTFTTIMRFEHPNEVTISELRVELIFPANESGAAFFRQVAARG
jgi:transcriptional regulator with XRE-family HTH domain